MAARIEFDKFIGDRLPKDRNGMPKRHLNTVAKIVEEEIERQNNTSHRSLAIVQAGYESAKSGEVVNLQERFGALRSGKQ